MGKRHYLTWEIAFFSKHVEKKIRHPFKNVSTASKKMLECSPNHIPSTGLAVPWGKCCIQSQKPPPGKRVFVPFLGVALPLTLAGKLIRMAPLVISHEYKQQSGNNVVATISGILVEHLLSLGLPLHGHAPLPSTITDDLTSALSPLFLRRKNDVIGALPQTGTSTKYTHIL